MVVALRVKRMIRGVGKMLRMKRVFMPAVIVLVASLAVITVTPLSAMSFYEWKYRPLLVFATSEDKAMLALQRQIVAGGRAGFADRDIVVIWVVDDGISVDFGPSPGQTAVALRTRYGASRRDFRVILVGKDGGTKLSAAAPLSAAALFKTIDAMPMRRDEMRRR
jgi:hypothetical protein